MPNIKNPMNYSDAQLGNATSAHVAIGLFVTVDVSKCATREEMLDAMREAAEKATKAAAGAAQEIVPEHDPRGISPKLAHALIFDENGRTLEMVDVL